MSTKDHKKCFVCNKFLHSGKFAIQFMQKDASCKQECKMITHPWAFFSGRCQDEIL